MITLEVLSSIQGENKIFFEDTKPEKRNELGKKIEELLRSGFEVFLVTPDDTVARRVAGYDPEMNEWIVYLSVSVTKPEPVAQAIQKPRAARGKERVSAGSTRIVGVGRTAGG